MKTMLSVFWNFADARLRAFWRLIFQLSLFAVLLVLMMLFVTSGIPAKFFHDSPGAEMALGAVAQNVAIIISIGVSCFFVDRRSLRSLGLNLTRRWWLDLTAGLLLGAGLMTAIFFTQLALGWITVAHNDQPFANRITGNLPWMIAMVFVGAGEELFSRGYHLKNLTEGMKSIGWIPSVVLASLLSSAFFGVIHYTNPESSALSCMLVCFAGILFCVGRIWTGSLAAPIGLHISWNYFEGGVFGFPVSGNQMDGSLFQIQQLGPRVWTGGKFGPEAGLLGFLAIVVGTGVFLMWPRPESNWQQSMIDLARFRQLRRSRAIV